MLELMSGVREVNVSMRRDDRVMILSHRMRFSSTKMELSISSNKKSH